MYYTLNIFFLFFVSFSLLLCRNHDGANAVDDQPRLAERPAEGQVRHGPGLVPADELRLLYRYAARVRRCALLY